LYLFLIFVWTNLYLFQNAESVTVVNNTLVNGTETTGTSTISTPSLHDLQVYGVIVTILLCFIVFGGVKIINKVAPAFLIPVLFSLLCIYLGVFIAPRHNAPSRYPHFFYFLIMFSSPCAEFYC
jgi:Na+/alanine symporter